MNHVDNSWQIPSGWAAAFAQPAGGFDCYETWAEVPANMQPPPSPVDNGVPQQVTMRQARLALNASSKLAAVQTAINGMAEPGKTNTQIWWDYSSMVERGQPLVAQLGAAIGLDSAGIDQLFVTAITL